MPTQDVALATPTKDFFITMLVRDIELGKAIADLVDNCVDGALRLKPSQRYAGLWVKIRTDQNHFEISDNCGGIPLDVARNYAFRFGRPSQATPTPHSVGEFGVGMKRALFKLGTKFRIESSTDVDHFTMAVDVEKWQKLDDWNLPFERVDARRPAPNGIRGTTITVRPLHPAVADQVRLPSFTSTLRDFLELAHEQALAHGLRITVNGAPLRTREPELLVSPSLRPVARKYRMTERGKLPVDIALYAGLSDSRPDEAGWYVYCNGRMVLRGDRTEITGWGDGAPGYHNQYAEFRGYVFFDSDDGGRLPWTTTKAAIDTNAAVYQQVRQQMVAAMGGVITFINRKDREKDASSTPLHDSVERAKAVKLSKLKDSDVFGFVESTPSTDRMATVSFKRPTAKVERVRKQLDVRLNSEIGGGVFDYYYRRECMTDA